MVKNYKKIWNTKKQKHLFETATSANKGMEIIDRITIECWPNDDENKNINTPCNVK